MHRAAILAASLAAACLPGGGSQGLDDTGPAPDTDPVNDDPVQWEPCESVYIDYVGPSAPVVGDSWSVWLYCDGALLMGPQVFRFDPLNFASVGDNNIITFKREGNGTMKLQVGAERSEMAVHVDPAP